MAAFDLTVSLGDIVALSVAVAGGLGCVFTVRSNVKVLSTVVSETDKRNEERFGRIDAQLEDYKLEMKKLADILVQLAKTDGRLNVTDQRILQEGQRIDKMAETLRALLMERRGLAVE
jgi:hypothetical protein